MKFEDLIPDRYEEIGSDPSIWAMNAQLLMRAARIICAQHEGSFSEGKITPRPGGGGIVNDPWTVIDFELFRVYYLLAGLALELQFKAILVARNPTIALKGVNWGCGRGGHDLKGLAQLAGIEISSYSSLIKHLTEAVIWRGKYPVDTRGSHLYEANFLNFGGSHVWGDSKNQIEKIYELGCEAYQQAVNLRKTN
jgi:hypothetical protein